MSLSRSSHNTARYSVSKVVGKGAEDIISEVHIFQINLCDSNVVHLIFFKNIQVKQSFECRTS